jgi:hypothetical protein
MNEEHSIHLLLRTKVERTAGFTPKSPKDFTRLEREIFAATRELISTSTLKRYWGYNGEKYAVKPFRGTLNILCNYIGFINWEVFCNSIANNAIGSNYINSEILSTRTLQAGDVIRLQWRPDRCVSVRYDGLDMFTVTESINSKLQPGDTFICPIFVKGEVLYLTHLVQTGCPPTNYACGRDGGIIFTVHKRSQITQ